MNIKKSKEKAKSVKQLTPEELNAFQHEVISWTAHLYNHHEKTKTWYITAGIIMLAFVIYAVLTKAWTFAVALIAYSYVYVYFHRKEPKKEKIVISEIGIKEGPHHYPFSSIQRFWIVYHPPLVKQLHIITNRRVMPEIVIQLEDQNPAEIRNYLCHQIPEWEGKEETFVDMLARKLKL